MRIHTPIDLGLAIKERRQHLGIDQRALATTVGVSRQWIIALEKGKPGAGLGLVLHTLAALGMSLSVEAPSGSSPEPETPPAAADVDAVIERLRGGRP